MANYNESNAILSNDESSYFDGGYFAYIGYHWLAGFVTIITLGIAYPWMCCMLQRWEAKHTVVCGKRKYFDGTGVQLIGKYLLWWFLTIITFGIYALWLNIAMKKWICKHTHFEGEEDNNSYFDGGVLGLLGTSLLAGLVTVVPFVGAAWGEVIRIRWETRHTVCDSRRLIFVGSVGSLFVKYLVWGLLTIITLGIFAWFMPVKKLRWQTEHTTDNEHTTEELIKRSEYRTNVHTDASTFKTYAVENEMEAMKSGITDAMSEESLLELANQGVRVAQYAYVIRYANDEYTKEPFSSLLKAAAEAEFAPAMCLYAKTHELEDNVRNQMIEKAAEKGQMWAIRNRMRATAFEALELPENKETLTILKKAVRYADLLIDSGEVLDLDEERVMKRCTFAIRRIESQLPKSSAAKTVLAVLLVIFVGIPAVVGIVAAIGAFFLKAPLPGRGFSGSDMQDSGMPFKVPADIEAEYKIEQFADPTVNPDAAQMLEILEPEQ